jgi:hypothetical protein
MPIFFNDSDFANRTLAVRLLSAAAPWALLATYKRIRD